MDPDQTVCHRGFLNISAGEKADDFVGIGTLRVKMSFSGASVGKIFGLIFFW